MRMRLLIPGAVLLALFFLSGLALTRDLALADPTGGDAKVLAITALLEAGSTEQGAPQAQSYAVETVAQSSLCCCAGADGRQCCAQASSCSVDPPGCFCRRR